MSTLFDDHALWIWDDGEPSPRNAWRLFRTTFDADDRAADAVLTITADTRYRVTVNAEPAGRGPVRGYTHDWFVDTWDVGPLLRPGRNVIAVLVQHLGVSTFWAQRGRGGLLGQITSGGRLLTATDATWRVATDDRHDPRANRHSLQMGFIEHIDARRGEDWESRDFDDSEWATATPVAEPGQGPWTSLRLRDIPALEETVVTPARVVQASRVTAPRFTAAVDLRSHLFPGSESHAQPVSYVAFALTRVDLATAGIVTFGVPWTKATTIRFSGICIDGRWWTRDQMDRGHADLHSVTLELAAGEHWIAFDVSGYDHGHALHLLIDGPGVVRAPHGADAPTPFVILGPVGSPDARLDRPLAHPAMEEMTADGATLDAIADATRRRSLDGWVAPASAVEASLVSPVSIYASVVHPSTRTTDEVGDLDGFGARSIRLPPADGSGLSVIVDFGREVSGYLEFEVEAPGGVVIDAYGFEYFHEGRREETLLVDNSLRYVTREGRQTYASPIRRGFRFLELVFRQPPDASAVDVHAVRVRESHFPVARRGRFSSSDPLLDEIWEMCRRTMIGCMEDTFVDCPAYEQTYWVGDAYLSSRIASQMFGSDDLIERCLRLVPGSAGQTAFLGSQVPSGWTNVIPDWTFFWIWACREHWFRTGDDGFAADILPAVAATLAAFEGRLDANGLLAIDAWNFLDWAEMDQPNTGVVAHQSGMMVVGLERAADLADAVGDPRGVAWRERAAALRLAIDAHLWSEPQGAYVDALHGETPSAVVSVQTQLVMLLAGTGTPEGRRRLAALAIDPPEHWIRVASPWMASFLFQALADRDRAGDALDRIRLAYGQMIEAGARTCWEAYPGSTLGDSILTRSHCHAWSASPGWFLPEVVLGIEQLEPGGRHYRVAPHVTDLDWASGAIALPGGGELEVEWRRRDDGGLDITATAPDGVEIEILPPALS